MLFSRARLWLAVRESWRPLARCRTSRTLARRRRVRRRWGAGVRDPQVAVGVLEAHPEVQPFALEQVGDLLDGLLADVLDLEQIVLAELDQVAERPDVRVLERIERPHRQAEVVDQLAEPLAQIAGGRRAR